MISICQVTVHWGKPKRKPGDRNGRSHGGTVLTGMLLIAGYCIQPRTTSLGTTQLIMGWAPPIHLQARKVPKACLHTRVTCDEGTSSAEALPTRMTVAVSSWQKQPTRTVTLSSHEVTDFIKDLCNNVFTSSLPIFKSFCAVEL